MYSKNLYIRISFAIAFTSVYFLLLTNIAIYLIFSNSFRSIAIATLAAFLFLGLAYDFSELVVAFFSRASFPSKLSELHTYPKVAVLYTTRHDARQECLDSLVSIQSEKCDVFILDDSDDDSQAKLFDCYNFHVCRRLTRNGYKAGNLNNWLFQYGKYYDYFVVLDSDSKITENFIPDMLKYAEHPDNQNIAIFQSKIYPWNTAKSFSRAVGLTAGARMYVTERMCNPLNSLISYGHNNLHRTKTIMSLGGFDQTLSPEDTAMSLRLSEFGFSCRLVDIISYDAEPNDLPTYLRRTSRWCQQTLEVLKRPWKMAEFGPKIAVCRNLLSYVLLLVYPVLLVATMMQPNFNSRVVANSWNYFSWAGRYDVLFIWILPLIILVANLGLNLCFSHRVGISIRSYLLSLFISIAINFCSILCIVEAFRMHFIGRKTVFNATNEYFNRELKSLSFLKACQLSCFPISLALFCLGVAFFYPANLLACANFIWVTLAALAPFLIWITHHQSKNLRT